MNLAWHLKKAHQSYHHWQNWSPGWELSLFLDHPFKLFLWSYFLFMLLYYLLLQEWSHKTRLTRKNNWHRQSWKQRTVLLLPGESAKLSPKLLSAGLDFLYCTWCRVSWQDSRTWMSVPWASVPAALSLTPRKSQKRCAADFPGPLAINW